ncbi:MAG TPA: hypothetical protein PKY30_03585 [Myxococcota bacterium]|nr:hypothetical protein [Myxococcota bacterium]HNH46092.1 hypothetical protein [Myxococcota bacterium]
MRLISALFLLPLLTGCDPDCTDFDRIDGTWEVWMTVDNVPREGSEGGLTLSEGYPTEELFINGTSRWKLNYQPSSERMTVLMNDVLEPTDLPGENFVFTRVEIGGSLKQDTENCNVLDLAMEDTYAASTTSFTGEILTNSSHTFTFAANLVYAGDQLSGTFTYSDTVQGTDGDEVPFEGSITDASGTFLGTRAVGG